MSKCIGCGTRDAPKHCYCLRCKGRLAAGWQCLEWDEIPDRDDMKQAKALVHSAPFVPIWEGQ